MKINYAILIVTILYFVGCTYDIGKPLIPKSSQANDSIAYHNIRDTTFTSINYFANGYIYPSDSTAIYNFDVDSNSVTDFIFETYHTYEAPQQPGGNYSYDIGYLSSGVSSLNSDNTLTALSTNLSANGNYIPLNGQINNSLIFSNSVTIYTSVIMTNFPNRLTDLYLGFKIHRGNNNYFGWILFQYDYDAYLITIKAWAINKNPNSCILAGQTH